MNWTDRPEDEGTSPNVSRRAATVATVKRAVLTYWLGEGRCPRHIEEWDCQLCRTSDQPHRHNTQVIAVPSQSFDKAPHWYLTRYDPMTLRYECPCRHTEFHGQGCKHQASINNVLAAEQKQLLATTKESAARRRTYRLEDFYED